MKLTPQEFAQQIRSKYPTGVSSDGIKYVDMDDDELTNRILTKYPIYKDKVESNSTTRDTIAEEGSGIGQIATDVAIGAGKGGVETLQGLRKFGSKFADQTAGRAVNLVTGNGFTPTKTADDETAIDRINTEATNTAQKVGKFSEQVAELAVPLTKVSKATKGMGLAKKVLTEGASAGGLETLRQGEFNNEAKFATVGGAALPIAGKVAGFGLDLSKNFLKGVAGGISGAGSDVIEKIFANPEAAKVGLTGESATVVKELAKKIIDSTKSISKEARDEYSAGLKNVQQLYKPVTKGEETIINAVGQERKLALPEVREKLGGRFEKFGVNFSNKDDAFLESPFVGDEQKAIERVNQLVNTWKDSTPEGLNDLAAKIGRFRKGDEARQFNSLIDGLKRDVRDYASEKVPEIGILNQKYAAKQDFLEAIEKTLGAGDGFTSTSDLLDVAQKLGTVFNKNKELARDVIEQLEKQKGIDILGVEAGRQLSPVVSKSQAVMGGPLQNFIGSIISPNFVGKATATVGGWNNKTKGLQEIAKKGFAKFTPAEKAAVIELLSSLQEDSD